MVIMGTKKKDNQIVESDNIKLAQKYHDQAIDYCYVYHEYDKALIDLRKAAALRESLFGKYHNETALSYFRIATILRDEKNDLHEALVVGRREFRISQMIMESSSDASLISTGTFTTTTSTRKEGGERGIEESSDDLLIERMEWFRSVLIDCKTTFSNSDVKTYFEKLLQTVEYERIGDEKRNLHDYENAISYYNCALTLESSAYARNILDMADLHIKIGECLLLLCCNNNNDNESDSALVEFENALINYLKQSENHKVTISDIYTKIGSILLKKRDFDGSLSAFANAYSGYEQIFGKDHDKSIDARNNLRLVTVKEMEYLRSEERLQRRQSKKVEKKKEKQQQQQQRTRTRTPNRQRRQKTQHTH